MTVGQAIASLIDAALAVWAAEVAVLIFRGGEALDGSLVDALPWVGIAAWCIAAPIVGFLFRRMGRGGVGALVAATPIPLVAIFLMI